MTLATAILQVHAACKAISPHADEELVRDALNAVMRTVDAEHWFYVTFLPGGEQVELRFLLGCPQSWFLVYEQHHWYLNDPLLRYAQFHGAPELASNLPLLTQGQQALAAAARQHGFVDGFVVPAQVPGNPRIGSLCFGYSVSSRLPRALFAELKPILSSLAVSVLAWDLAGMQADLLNTSRLTKRERELLRYECLGYTSKEIAAIESGPVNAINRGFASAMAKLQVNSRAQAARLARMAGLIQVTD